MRLCLHSACCDGDGSEGGDGSNCGDVSGDGPDKQDIDKDGSGVGSINILKKNHKNNMKINSALNNLF